MNFLKLATVLIFVSLNSLSSLITALQLVQVEILRSWGISSQGVVGHSSGEIVAASAAGYLTPEEAIKIAYLRGQAAMSCPTGAKTGGMLAVGLGVQDIAPILASSNEDVVVSCYNSNKSVTLSGLAERLERLRSQIESAGHFARLLEVDLAYHSKYVASLGERYKQLLAQDCIISKKAEAKIHFSSSVTGSYSQSACGLAYWKANMVCPVSFEESLRIMLNDEFNLFIELGLPSTLSGPVSHILQSVNGGCAAIEYCTVAKRSQDCLKTILNVAGQLYLAGAPVAYKKVNKDLQGEPARIFVDLPSYSWNHSAKYWYESESRKDWRFRKIVAHDLLGSKILGTAWESPNFKKTLQVNDLPWLQDHKVSQSDAYVCIYLTGF